VKPQATRTPSYLPVRPDGQVDRVEHEAQQADLAEAPCPEGPVAVAQLAAHGAHRRPADRTQASLSGEALDVTVTQAPDVGADDERLQRPGPDDRARVGDHPRDEASQGVPDLGHRDRDLALGGLDPPGAVAVARACGVGGPRIAGPPEERGHLVLDRALEDELGAETAELAQLVGTADPVEQGGLDGGLDLDAGGYSSIHGVVSFANFQGPLWSLRRLHFYSGLRTPPKRVIEDRSHRRDESGKTRQFQSHHTVPDLRSQIQAGAWQ
jgi:hypothetical protein